MLHGLGLHGCQMVCNQGISRLTCGSKKTKRHSDMVKTLVVFSDRLEISITIYTRRVIKVQRAAGLEYDLEQKGR